MEADNHSFTLENNFLLEKTKKTLPRKSMSKLIDETLHYLNIFHVCALLFEFLTAAGTEVSSSCWWHLYFKIQLMIRWNNAWPANVPKKHLHDSEAHEDWVASKLNQVNHHNWFWWIKNELVVKLKNKRVLQLQFWAKTFWKWYFGVEDIFSKYLQKYRWQHCSPDISTNIFCCQIPKNGGICNQVTLYGQR